MSADSCPSNRIATLADDVNHESQFEDAVEEETKMNAAVDTVPVVSQHRSDLGTNPTEPLVRASRTASHDDSHGESTSRRRSSISYNDQHDQEDEDEYLDVDDESDYDDDDDFLIASAASKRKRKRASSGPRVTFSCEICGRKDFCTEMGSLRHAQTCTGERNNTTTGKKEWKCPTCGKDDFSTSQALGGHSRNCKGQNVSSTSMSLLGSHLENDKDKLSQHNKLLVESFELFEATDADVYQQSVGNGVYKIRKGNIGLRCRGCAESGQLKVGSVVYTRSLKTLPHSMYVMRDRHLYKNCQATTHEVVEALNATKKKSITESMTKGAIGLPAYCRLVFKSLGLVDGKRNDGVYRRETNPEGEPR